MRRPGRRVTIYDVAERASVSISTVSLAINAPHRVREATRARILAAAGALGYRIAPTAARDATGTRIAVAAPFSTYPSYLRRLAGILRRTRSTAIEVVVHDLDSAARASAPLLDALPVRDGLGGVVVMGVPPSGAALRAARESRLPVVLVDVRSHGSSSPPTVLVDDRAGGDAIGRHLVDRGHRRVVYLHEPQRSSDYRSAGMERVAAIAARLEVVDAVCVPSADPAEVAFAALEQHPAATAVVAHYDDLAVEVWRGMRTWDARRQRDVALVGYDDGPAAEAMGLTTVRQPFEESGAAAIELMMEALGGVEVAPRTVTLQPELVVRDSTARLPR